MLSVIIPTANSEAHLAETLSSLVPAAVEGLIREVIVVDSGSTDQTLAIADDAGAEIIKASGGRGAQLRAGVARARFPWLLILDADTVLDVGWQREAALHIERVESGRRRAQVASFRFKLDDEGALPRTFEALISLRSRLLRLPCGEQGLLMPRTVYDQAGGFEALSALEDMDLLRRIGRKHITFLDSRATVGGERYRQTGYASHIARGQLCLLLYVCGVPVRTIAAVSGSASDPVGEPAIERGVR